ncbi:MAG: hypothetical protein VR69_09570 [Peptococcaceae bacterium BRH_c4b]|nr:MAG: hypothetical protein VR69_09570 [Peptococcaceae bacterium BRH_c4b]
MLKCLTKRERESYWLVRGQGYSFGQAATILKCKKASVQSYIKRAEKKIQFAIRKQTYSEGVC